MKAIIQTPTNKLDDSLDFYSRLNFELIELNERTIFSDGKAIIEVNPDRYARAGLKLYADNWRDIADELQEMTPVIQTRTGFLLADPSGSMIYLEECGTLPSYDLAAIQTSVLGNFAGLSLETTDLQKSLAIWLKLGFKITSGSAEHGWMSLIGPSGFTVSIMKILNCPHLFFNPSLSYFNGQNNPAIIQKIRELDIPITEEITVFNDEGIVDNIIIRDRGGLGFFIFND
ncbi:hypothetical protein [Mangrovibacterium lignilyticum]|uniref:hypothetical protein n=1 Tax=Mangrovibacterium lignilyticum TaxID=2668052 RepID=UPI0013D67C91|nr:hypothetical protein [Mangrovibacterium lignilyticum]